MHGAVFFRRRRRRGLALREGQGHYFHFRRRAKQLACLVGHMRGRRQLGPHCTQPTDAFGDTLECRTARLLRPFTCDLSESIGVLIFMRVVWLVVDDADAVFVLRGAQQLDDHLCDNSGGSVHRLFVRANGGDDFAMSGTHRGGVTVFNGGGVRRQLGGKPVDTPRSKRRHQRCIQFIRRMFGVCLRRIVLAQLIQLIADQQMSAHQAKLEQVASVIHRTLGQIQISGKHTGTEKQCPTQGKNGKKPRIIGWTETASGDWSGYCARARIISF